MTQKKISLVLSSGGARGFSHIGVIETLLEKGYEIEQITGSSMGSVIASMYASGNLEKFKEWALTLDKFKVFSLMDFTVAGYGVMKGDKAFSKLKSFIKDENIENLNIPIKIIASDVIKIKEKVFKKGSMYEAMRASCSIPGLVQPYRYKKTELIDGGVLNPLPIDHLDSPNAILTVNLNNTPKINLRDKYINSDDTQYYYYNLFREYFTSKSKDKKKLNIFDLTNKSVHMMQNKLAQETLLKYKVDYQVNIPFDSCYSLEFYKAEKMINLGRKLCLKALKTKSLVSKY